ncbi:MAG: radical SAM protein [Candidatus Wallbacteria bacterium]|nr:radical SAM protein [Candidatus Wallbacteria bacterium]
MNLKKILFVRLYQKYDFNFTTPPTGFLYIPAVISEKYPQVEMSFFDFSLPSATPSAYRSMLDSIRPDCVMFSGTYMERDQLRWASGTARKILKDVLCICGGVLVTTAPEEVLMNQHLDFAVGGEGEERILKLLANLSGNIDLDGIGYQKDRTIHYNPPVSMIPDIETIPFPKWDLLDFKAYSGAPTMNGTTKFWPYCTVSTSRGCPFSCSYCHHTMGRQFRARSPESVRDEIDRLVTGFGIREIHFIDDCFNLDLERAKKICRLIIESKFRIGIAFPNALKGDYLDEELIFLLKKAGCWSVTVAVENISPRIVKMMDKKLDLSRLRKNVRLLNKYGIYTTAYFMYGFPEETLEERRLNGEFADCLEIESLIQFRYIPFPNTRIKSEFYQDLDLRKISSRNFVYTVKNPGFNKTCMSEQEIDGSVRSNYLSFYSNPRRLLRIMRKYPKKYLLKHLPTELGDLIKLVFSAF